MGLPGGIGDLIMISPIIRNIRKNFPKAEITFGVGGNPFLSVVEANPYIDHILSPFSFENDPFKLEQQKKDLARQYDKTILFHIPKDPIKLRRKLRQWLEKKGFYWDKRHIIERYAELACIELSEKKPQFYFNEGDLEEAEQFLEKHQIFKNDLVIVVAHTVGNSKFFRSWPLNHFEKLIKKILDEHNCKVILTGSKSDPIFPDPRVINMLGFPLRPTACVIKSSDLFIGMDSGLTHIASCFVCNIISIHIGYPIFYSGALSKSICFLRNKTFQKPEFLSVDQVYAVTKQKILEIQKSKK